MLRGCPGERFFRSVGFVLCLVLVFVSSMIYWPAKEAEASVGAFLASLLEFGTGAAMGSAALACLAIAGVAALALAGYGVSSYIQRIRHEAARDAMADEQLAALQAVAGQAEAGTVHLSPEEFTAAGGAYIVASYSVPIEYAPVSLGLSERVDGGFDCLYPRWDETFPAGFFASLSPSVSDWLSASSPAYMSTVAVVGQVDHLEFAVSVDPYVAYFSPINSMVYREAQNAGVGASPCVVASVHFDADNRATGQVISRSYTVGLCTVGSISYVFGTTTPDIRSAFSAGWTVGVSVSSVSVSDVEDFNTRVGISLAAQLMGSLSSWSTMLGVSVTGSMLAPLVCPIGFDSIIKSAALVGEVGSVAIPTGGIYIPQIGTSEPPISVPLVGPDVRAVNPTLDNGLSGVPIGDTIAIPVSEPITVPADPTWPVIPPSLGDFFNPLLALIIAILNFFARGILWLAQLMGIQASTEMLTPPMVDGIEWAQTIGYQGVTLFGMVRATAGVMLGLLVFKLFKRIAYAAGD